MCRRATELALSLLRVEFLLPGLVNRTLSPSFCFCAFLFFCVFFMGKILFPHRPRSACESIVEVLWIAGRGLLCRNERHVALAVVLAGAFWRKSCRKRRWTQGKRCFEPTDRETFAPTRDAFIFPANRYLHSLAESALNSQQKAAHLLFTVYSIRLTVLCIWGAWVWPAKYLPQTIMHGL